MIAVVDYATGNLRSVADALRRAGAEFTLTADPALLRGADKVILPGVGEASSAMSQLRERGLDTVIPSLTQPVLGICIGMQLMCLSSEEGDARCMGIFPTQVLRLPATADDGARLKVPHVGWDTITSLRSPGKPMYITSTPSPPNPAPQPSPRPTTVARSARRSGAATSSARSSTPKKAVRRARGFYSIF